MAEKNLVRKGLYNVAIKSIGYYVPSREVTNKDLEKVVDTTDEWIVTRTGISSRRLAEESQTTMDLAVVAAQNALKKAGMDAEELDLIILGTSSPEMIIPATSCFVQQKIGATRATAFDISAACSGFLFAMCIAHQFIATGHYKNVMTIGAETLSKYIDWQDRSTCVIFADGAGAAIITRANSGHQLIATKIHSNGNNVDLIQIPGGGSRYPASEKTLRERLHYIKMKGNETFRVAVKALEEVCREILEENNLKPSDVDLLVPHQANVRIIEYVTKRLHIPMDRVVINIDHIGNTSAASIPIALGEAIENNRMKEGDLVMMMAFGGGLAWSSSLVKW